MIKKVLKKIRIFFLLILKYKFIKVGKNFYCGKHLMVRPNTVEIGNDVFIGSYANLAVVKLKIEDFVMLAPRVGIVGGDHKFNVVGLPIKETGRDIEKEVLLKKDCWIGYNSTILHGVTIGEGSIIAANSLVTKDVPPYTIWGGQPAKFMKNRFNNESDAVRHSKIIKGDFYENYG